MIAKKYIFYIIKPFWMLFDLFLKKRNDFWAFSTHHLHAGKFIENQRALFEFVKKDQAIKKIIFYRGIREDFEIEDAHNYEIVEHGSLRGLWLLARCKVVFLTHSISMDYSIRWGKRGFFILPLSMRNRVVVNLWHAISLKRLYYTANSETRLHTDRVKYRNQERIGYKGLIASSDIDSYAMAAMFFPLNYLQVWCTGLPRNDFLTCEENYLPIYIRRSLEKIRSIKKDKKLIVYAPTYRQVAACDGAYYYQFSNQEILKLKTILKKNNVVLGYRPHYFNNSTEYFNLDEYIDGETIVDLSMAAVPEFSAVARECDFLITDYSSVYLETLYLGKPAICFAYDLESYKKQQDGLLYDLSLIFPGNICESFDDVLKAIEYFLVEEEGDIHLQAKFVQKMFFSYCDGGNSERVFNRVKAEINHQI
jgi:CDP-glycerol glycerophosphotransferase